MLLDQVHPSFCFLTASSRRWLYLPHPRFATITAVAPVSSGNAGISLSFPVFTLPVIVSVSLANVILVNWHWRPTKDRCLLRGFLCSNAVQGEHWGHWEQFNHRWDFPPREVPRDCLEGTGLPHLSRPHLLVLLLNRFIHSASFS